MEYEIFYKEAKQKINALNTVLLRKYEKKQNLDSKITRIIVQKLDLLESRLSDKDDTLTNDIESIKRTLNGMQDQQSIFSEFIHEEN